MRCLYVFAGMPLSPNWSGGASRIAMPPKAIRLLGGEVHVLRFLEEGERTSILDYEAAHEAESPASLNFASWCDVAYERPRRSMSRSGHLRKSLLDPLGLRFPEATELAKQVVDITAKVRPDFVWAGWIPAAPAVHLARLGLPWVAVHTDWVHELIGIRNPVTGLRARLRQALDSSVAKRADLVFLRGASAIETGSTVQAEQMRAFGLKNIHVIPQTFENPDFGLEMLEGPPRIVHFGSLETTSNRVGLSAFLDRAYAETTRRLVSHGIEAPLWIVGDVSTAKPDLRAKLEAAQAVCTGYVHDLASVLRPFDIQIIPYEAATGLRSKVAQLFGYAQALVATRASVSGMPELVSGENCVLVDRAEDFPAAIERLALSPDERRRLGLAARETVNRHFRLEALLPRYDVLINSVLAPGEPRSHCGQLAGRTAPLENS